MKRAGSSPASMQEQILSNTPVYSAALLMPCTVTVTLLFWIRDLGGELPRMALLILLAVVTGILEILSGIYIIEEKLTGSTAAGLRRSILSLLLILLLTLPVIGLGNMLLVPVFLLYLLQWFGSGALRSSLEPLQILQQYAAGKEHAELARKMRETETEAREFTVAMRFTRGFAAFYASGMVLAAVISNFAGVQLHWFTAMGTLLLLLEYILMRYLTASMERAQSLLQEGVRIPSAEQRRVGVHAFLLTLAVVLIALLMTPGTARFPLSSLVDWIKLPGFERELLQPEQFPRQFPADQLLQYIEELPETRRVIRLDLVFRAIGIAMLAVLLLFLIRPLFSGAVYRSIGSKHPLRRLASIVTAFLRGCLHFLAETGRVVRSLFTAHSNDQLLKQWEIPGRYSSPGRVSRRKRKEQDAVLRGFFSIVAAADSLRLSYFPSRGPGTFLTVISEYIAAHPELLPAITPDNGMERGLQNLHREDLQLLLNCVLYGSSTLPQKLLASLLEDMKGVSKVLRGMQQNAALG